MFLVCPLPSSDFRQQGAHYKDARHGEHLDLLTLHFGADSTRRGTF